MLLTGQPTQLNSVNKLQSAPGTIPSDKKSAVRTSEASALRGFVLTHMVAITTYFGFFAYFTFAHYHAQPLIWNLVLCVGLTALIWAYWQGYKQLERNPSIDNRAIVALALVASAVSLLIPTFLSNDVLFYINAGWQQFHCHENPYVRLMLKAPGFGTDPMFSNIWALNPFPYGFAFAHITKFLCQVGGGNLARTVWAFKILNWFVYAGLGAVVWLGSKHLGQKRPELSLYLYLFSPLMLLHAVSNGHNDILMMFMVMAGLLAAGSSLSALALSAIVAGSLIKYLWIIALPFTAIFLMRSRGAFSLLLNVVLAAAAFAAISWQYIWEWRCYRWEQIAINVSLCCNSFQAAVHDEAMQFEKVVLHNHAVTEVTIAPLMLGCKFLLSGSFALLLLYFFFRSVFQRQYLTQTRLIWITTLSTMLWVSLVSAKFYPWYQVMFFPVALWLPERSELRRLAILLTCSQLFAFTFLGKSHISNYVVMTVLPFAWWGWKVLQTQKTNEDGEQATLSDAQRKGFASSSVLS